MSYDLIIVTQSNGHLIDVTHRCIYSSREDGAELNIIIVETGNPYRYDVDRIIPYNGEFNYNRALNMGLKYVKHEIHILANNDLIFRPGWSKIGALMVLNGYHSASCVTGNMNRKGDVVYEGYDIESILTGWCIFVDRYCIEKIGQLDETVSFWFSDNLYAEQIKAAGIKHGLFANCQIDHLVSETLKKQPTRLQRKYQMGEMSKYLNRKNHYAKIKNLHGVDTQDL